MYHSSTRRGQQLQDWQEPLSLSKLSLLYCYHPQREQALPVKQHSALILEPKTDSRGVQRAAFNVHTVVHIWNSITGYPSIMEMKSVWDIHIGIYQHMIPKRSKRKKFSSESSCEFPKKSCSNISYL